MDTFNFGHPIIVTGGATTFPATLEPQTEPAPHTGPTATSLEPSFAETALSLSDTEFDLPETATGKAVKGIVSAAYDLADTAGHPIADMDCVVCVLARSLPGLLGAVGVSDVDGLRTQLVGYIMRPNGEAARADAPAPVVGDDVVAVLDHAKARAREKGRRESTIEDLLEAIVYAIRNGNYQSQGAVLLRARWRELAIEHAMAQVMARLRDLPMEVGILVDRAVEQRVRLLSDQIGAERVTLNHLSQEVDSVSRRLPDLRPPLPEIPKTRVPRSWVFWKRQQARREAVA